MAVIFVTHDIGAAVEICDRVSVMYAGRIVETGTMREVVMKPAHPYTQGLLASTIKAPSEVRGLNPSLELRHASIG